MTEPPFGGSQEPPPYDPTPPWPSGAPGYFPPPVYPGYSPNPMAPYGVMDPMAPYGRHPFTGEPLSDKSKVVAGLLQLLGLAGVLGVGRIYLGQTGFGVGQLVGCLVFGLVTCGFGFIVPVIWAIVDAVLILTDKVRDQQGRPLRDGI